MWFPYYTSLVDHETKRMKLLRAGWKLTLHIMQVNEGIDKLNIEFEALIKLLKWCLNLTLFMLSGLWRA